MNTFDIMSKELLGDIAQKITEEVIKKSSYKDKKGEIKYNLTRGQIRKFYCEFKDVERKLSSNKIDDANYGRIKLIKAKAIYNMSRMSSKLPKSFVDFVTECVDNIKSDDNDNYSKFIRICRLFEAFVGYSSAFKLDQ